jgi:hypothetical protein
MEQNMSEVSGMLGNLRNMAIDMGSEISAQNNQLGRITSKVSSVFRYQKSFDRYIQYYVSISSSLASFVILQKNPKLHITLLLDF